MESKQLVGERAVESVRDGMVVGLGTGSTAIWAIRKIGARVAEGLRIQAVPTSMASEELARKLHIPLVGLEEIEDIDLTIDGADEVDEQLRLIKGGGGALLREKVVASLTRQQIIVVDESKLVRRLGAFPLPVEVIPFAWHPVSRQIEALGCSPKRRQAEDGRPFVTDNGNYILDCRFKVIEEPADLNRILHLIPGVVETGLFVDMADRVLVGSAGGSIRILEAI